MLANVISRVGKEFKVLACKRYHQGQEKDISACYKVISRAGKEVKVIK